MIHALPDFIPSGPALEQRAIMLSHDSIWAAIDRLAETNSLTPSGLARRAGLDETALRAKLQRVIVWNFAALLLSALGLMMVVIGIALG